MKKQKGFIQIPIFIAIITGVLVVSGAGYFGANQYRNYKVEKQKKEREMQALAEKQKKILGEAQIEIEKLKEEGARSQKKQSALEQEVQRTKQTQEKSKQPPQAEAESKKIVIHVDAPYNLADIVDKWEPYIVEIECQFRDSSDKLVSISGGSGTLMKIDQLLYNGLPLLNSPYLRVLTNRHILVDKYGNTPHSCKVFNFYYNFFKYSFSDVVTDEGSISKDPKYDWGTLKLPADHKTVKYFEEILNTFNPADHLCGKIPFTVGRPSTGDEIATLGFPEIGAGDDVTVTRGIISGLRDNDYLTDAKIDRGNSGGSAVHLKYGCFLGIPTAAAVGDIESLARIFADVPVFGTMSPEEDQAW